MHLRATMLAYEPLTVFLQVNKLKSKVSVTNGKNHAMRYSGELNKQTTNKSTFYPCIYLIEITSTHSSHKLRQLTCPILRTSDSSLVSFMLMFFIYSFLTFFYQLSHAVLYSNISKKSLYPIASSTFHQRMFGR